MIIINISKFISEHLINKEVDVYCTHDSSFQGKAIGCADNVLTLLDKTATMTFINIPHIIAIWEKKREKSDKS